MVPAEQTAGRDTDSQGAAIRLERSAAVALAAGIRTLLQFQQQMGVEYYPLTPDLQKCLAGKAEKYQQPSPSSPPRPAIPRPVSVVETSEQRASLRQDIEDCRLCPLVSMRHGQVLGAGTGASRLLIIGDYSSQKDEFSPTTLFDAAEDGMLWNMIRAIGLAPEDVYVTNTIKCCPQTAQQPDRESEQHCLAHLRREIELLRPRIICAMGEVAARAVLGSSEPVLRLRGRFHPYKYSGDAGESTQVMVTFHPRFLLQYGDMKKAAWKDLQMVQRQLQVR